MTALAIVAQETVPLPALIDRAAKALANAMSSAEILEARDIAGIVYDTARMAARLARAKGAHDTLIATAHRAQADALEIEAGAKRRLADEYDAAQERGEVAKRGWNKHTKDDVPTGEHLGLSRKEIHEARQVRDVEQADPGIIRRTLDEAIESGEEPTRALVKKAVKAKSGRTKKPRRQRGHQHKVEESQHDRDLRSLLGIWEAACQSARDEFLNIVIN